MHKLMALIARSDPGMRVSPLRGGEGEQVRTGGFVLTWQRTRDGLITIGNDPAAGTAPAEPLVSSSAFQAVLAKAGAPSGANVAAYFDVAGLLRLIPISTDPNLHHVGAIVAWSDAHGQDRSSDLFVEVR
jgi:hypothetical protein